MVWMTILIKVANAGLIVFQIVKREASARKSTKIILNVTVIADFTSSISIHVTIKRNKCSTLLAIITIIWLIFLFFLFYKFFLSNCILDKRSLNHHQIDDATWHITHRWTATLNWINLMDKLIFHVIDVFLVLKVKTVNLCH